MLKYGISFPKNLVYKINRINFAIEIIGVRRARCNLKQVRVDLLASLFTKTV